MREHIQFFWSFFKIGSFTFGGGLAMLPLIQKEIIDKHKWINNEEFIELLAIAQTSPGPVALNTAVFVGYKRFGIKGAVTAILGTVIPSFVIILAIAIFFADFTKYPMVESAFKGMRPAVVALIAAPLISLAKGMGITKIIIAAAAAIIISFLGVSPIYFIIAGAIGGIIYGLSR